MIYDVEYDELTLEEVFDAYYECRQNKRGSKGALEFESDLENNLVTLWHDLLERKYEIGTSTCFIVTHPKKREVFAADFRDRVVHHIIMHRLEPLMEELLIDDVYNCRKGKGVLYGVKRLKEKMNTITEDGKQKAWVLKCDLQGFFMSIHKPTLWKMLEEFIRKNYKGKDIDLLLYMVEKVVMHCPAKNCVRHSPIEMWEGLPPEKSLFNAGDDYGLPIGNLTSQVFANFYLHCLDDMLYAEFGGMYGRYVDDFYVLSRDKQKLLDIIPKVRRYLKEELGVTLHPRKIYLQPVSHGLKFTGMVTNGQKMYTGSGTVNNAYNKIVKYNWVKDKEPMLQDYITVLNSYLGFMSHSQSFALRRILMNTVSDEWWQYIYFMNHCCKAVIRSKYRRKKIKL